MFENRSAEKYANVLRHLFALKRNGGIPGTVQDYIRNYNVKPYGAKMRGIEAQDRADNPNAAAATRVADLRKKGEQTAAIYKIGHNFGITGRKVVRLIGQTNTNGEVEVLKVEELDNDETDSFYYNLGRAA